MYPERTIRRLNTSLEAFKGEWPEILRQLLKEFGCTTKIPVKIFTYHDGRIFVKYRVALKLPTALGLNVQMPDGEARTQGAAFDIAVVRAITLIRELKAREIRNMAFIPIPHQERENDQKVDHYFLAKNEPAIAARYMDRCQALLGSFYDTHRTLVAELERVLGDLTDPQKVQEFKIGRAHV